MAETTNVASDLMPREAAQAGRDAAMRSRDDDGRRGMPGELTGEARRITPRSPRAALEPERVVMPTKWSKSARHPLVIAGNAVFTVLILIAIVGGILFAVMKHRYETAGPLEADKIVNIPPRLGTREIADLLAKEGVIDHPLTFIVMALL